MSSQIVVVRSKFIFFLGFLLRPAKTDPLKSMPSGQWSIKSKESKSNPTLNLREWCWLCRILPLAAHRRKK